MDKDRTTEWIWIKDWTLEDGEKCEICDPVKCNCGLKLNTNMPFIGRCIQFLRYNATDYLDKNDDGTLSNKELIVVNQLNAFAVLISGLIKILMSSRTLKSAKS